MRVNDFDNKVHLFSIRDNALDVFTYPIMCTLSDLKVFLSARMECDYSVFPEFLKYPDGVPEKILFLIVFVLHILHFVV